MTAMNKEQKDRIYDIAFNKLESATKQVTHLYEVLHEQAKNAPDKRLVEGKGYELSVLNSAVGEINSALKMIMILMKNEN